MEGTSHIEHWKFKVSGKVQGVNYRASALQKANALGLHGFVRNQPDGAVYIEAEGSPNRLDAFACWIRQGPPLAQVEAVEAERGVPVGFDGFNILHG